jgi:hypothetical protein
MLLTAFPTGIDVTSLLESKASRKAGSSRGDAVVQIPALMVSGFVIGVTTLLES